MKPDAFVRMASLADLTDPGPFPVSASGRCAQVEGHEAIPGRALDACDNEHEVEARERFGEGVQRRR